MNLKFKIGLLIILLGLYQVPGICQKPHQEENGLAIFYINMASCRNCQVGILPIVHYVNKHYNLPYRFVVEHNERSTEANLLSTYLQIPIPDSLILVSDSIVQLIKSEIGFSSGLLLKRSDLTIILDLESVHFTKDHIDKALQIRLSGNKIPEEESLTDHIWLNVSDYDTVLIDRNLGKVYGFNKPFDLPKYSWQIENLWRNDFNFLTDSFHQIFRIEYSNSFSLYGQRVFLATTNRVISFKEGQLEVIPVTFLLAPSPPMRSGKFACYFPFGDSDRCFFDDYTIMGRKDEWLIIKECGSSRLDPWLYKITHNKEGFYVQRISKLKLTSKLKSAPGYVCDFTQAYIYFVGVNSLYFIPHHGKMIELQDCTPQVARKEFVVGVFTETGTEDLSAPTWILVSTPHQNIVRKYNTSEKGLSQPFMSIVLPPSQVKKIISNIHYNEESNTAFFVDHNHRLMSLYLPGVDAK